MYTDVPKKMNLGRVEFYKQVHNTDINFHSIFFAQTCVDRLPARQNVVKAKVGNYKKEK